MIENLKLMQASKVDCFLNTLLMTNDPLTLGFLNQHGVNLICENEENRSTFSDVDYLLRDGIGIALACRYWGLEPGANLNGTDLIPLFIEKVVVSGIACNFFAYGTQSPWLETGSENLFHGNSFLSLDGFKENNLYCEHFKANQTPSELCVVVLAMGMPKQEKVAALIKEVSKGPVIIICGGAILDFCAHKVKRAPKLIRALNLEWAYRLCMEPRRLFKRYVIGIPLFLINIVKHSR